ncbi:MAG TPA: PEGA domain-containing protein [Myxococcaceae bacterium]|nr:PEGA domain-containing protein [Myxococcaceae bacterium]
MTSLRVAVLLALTSVGVSSAAEQRPNLLVLDLEPRGVGLPEAQAATGSVVRGLRQLEVFQVLSSDDVRQLLALERTRQLSGTKAENSVGQLGAALNAPNAVVGSVTRVGGKLQVEIRLLDAPTQKVLSQKSLNQATVEQVAAQLPGLAQELMAPLLREQQGFLVVRSREEAAEVLVDDTLVGSIPLKGSIDLSRGVHRLTVRKDGFIAQTRSVRIEPKQTTVEEVELAPSSDYAKVYKDKYGKMRVGAWIATGVAIAGITTAVVMNASASSQYNDEFKPRQAWLQGAVGTGPQTKPPEIANNPTASAAWDSCTATGAAACKQAAEDAKSSVQVKQYVAIGAGVIGVASAGVATWLWLSGKDPNRYADVVAGVSPNGQGGATLALAGRF